VKFHIGGEFELNTDILAQGSFSRPVSDMNFIYTDLGRSAIYLALQAILQHGGSKQAWLPAYCCSTVMLPFRELGFDINFYSMGHDLKTPAGLPTQLNDCTFLYIHYFGTKNVAIIDWLAKQMTRKENCFVIEDCVQASLSDNVGFYGDFSVRSYRKFLPQPDGALLAYTHPFDYQLAQSNEAFISRKVVGKLLRGSDRNESNFLALFDESEQIIDQNVTPRHMSWISNYLSAKTDIDSIKRQRRKNWLCFHSQLQESSIYDNLIQPLFPNLEEGAVPLGYPVFVRHNLRNELRSYLMQNNIFCPIHWAIEEDNYAGYDDIGAEKEISLAILTLPIDQRITDKMLQYMLKTIEAFFNKEIK
jgi:hypothetical protein